MLGLGAEALDDVEEAIADLMGSIRAQVVGDVLIALMFGAMAGWAVAIVWLSAVILLRLVHFATAAHAERRHASRRTRGILNLAFSSATYLAVGALASIATWRTGIWAAMAAMQMLTVMVLYGSHTARKSLHAYIAFVGPIALHMLTICAVLIWGKAPSAPMICISVQAMSAIFISLQVWRASAASQSAEINARRQAETATAAKSAFVAMVSHELRTPISGILAGADEIKRSDDPGLRNNAGLIHDSARMMRRLLDDLLDLSKIEAGRMSVEDIDFDLRQLVHNTVRFWAPEARRQRLRFRLEGAHGLPRWVRGDPTRLRQILNNLFSNALKFTNEGSVTLRISAGPGGGGKIELTFEVLDTGSGMSTEEVEGLFGAFHQLHASTARTHGGTGLGLNISRQLARLMDGDLTATSVAGEGSAFRLKFAAAPGQPVAVSDDAVDGSSAASVRVLVADDHDVNRQAFSLILKSICEDVVCVEDGEEALQALGVARFDVILMDLNMPRMGGLEATRRLRAESGPNQSTPVIALTASVSPREVDTCLAAGMNSFVMKPVEARELIAAVAEALVAHGERGAAAA